MRFSTLLLVIFSIGLTVSNAESAIPRAGAQVLTVNSVADAPDLAIDGSCDTGATVAGGAAECTLRAAIQEANATPNFDEIRFDIPGCPGGICVIDIVTAGGNFLPDLTAPVSIDGSTQPGNAGVCATPIPDRPAYRVVLNGDGVDIGLRIEQGGDGSVIRGLNIRNFFNNVTIVEAGNARVECNFIGTDETGTSAAVNNAANGIAFLCQSTGNVIGGPNAEDGNLISGHASDGVQLFASATCGFGTARLPSDNAVLANFIGTAADGVTPLGNEFAGISMFGEPGADGNFIGVLQDGVSVRGNVIGASGTSGVLLDGDPGGVDGTDNTLILGNFIGTDIRGQANLGSFFGGVDIVLGDNNQVGSPEHGNVIAFNSEGVFLEQDAGEGNRISGNRMDRNINLGIELVQNDEFGVNPNDPGDIDSGANRLQNSPVLVDAVVDDRELTVTWNVDFETVPLTIEFFTADADDEEGLRYLGSADYTAAGNASAVFPAGDFGGAEHIVATAIDAVGNTSEFSAALVVQFVELLLRDGFELP